MNLVVETRGLTKTFGATTAVDCLDLVVLEGEVFGFLGPNGAGKTTTIRMLMGLIRPSGGRATIFGRDAWSDPVAIHARVAFVPADPALWPQLLSEVEATADRVGLLRRGRLVEVGTFDDLRHLSAVTIDATFAGPAPDLRGVPGGHAA
jgi:ABC-type multidrug transport system ATPase subunit